MKNTISDTPDEIETPIIENLKSALATITAQYQALPDAIGDNTHTHAKSSLAFAMNAINRTISELGG